MPGTTPSCAHRECTSNRCERPSTAEIFLIRAWILAVLLNRAISVALGKLMTGVKILLWAVIGLATPGEQDPLYTTIQYAIVFFTLVSVLFAILFWYQPYIAAAVAIFLLLLRAGQRD